MHRRRGAEQLDAVIAGTHTRKEYLVFAVPVLPPLTEMFDRFSLFNANLSL